MTPTPFTPFPAEMFPNTVTVKRVTEARDSKGGSSPFAAASQSFQASVQGKGQFQREVGNPGGPTWQSVSAFHVSFPSDPGVALGDEIDWGGRVLNVLGRAWPVGGWQNLWRVHCEEVL